MRLIDERDERTRNRKLKKQQYDKLMTLAVAEDDRWVRLLDEGTVTYAGGEAYMYITKGTLRAFYENLDPEYVGSVNVGHTDMATFPDRIVGEWTKDDLRLVSIGDGREALDVRLRLYEDHPVVRALQKTPFELGVSAEFAPNFNEELTANETLNPLHVPVIDGVDIKDFAIVGDAGNVNSMGVRLKGETMVDVTKLGALLDEEGKRSIEDVNVLLSALDEGEETTEEVIEETEEVAEETTEEAEEVTEEAEEQTEETTEEAEEATEEAAEEDDDDDEEDEDDLAEEINHLLDEVEHLRTENAVLKEKLESKDKEWAVFSARFKKMTVSKTDTKKPEVKAKVRQYTDGIGE